MKVQYDKNNRLPPFNADLYRIGRCLAIFENGNVHRIYLTPTQWALLADTAAHAAQDGAPKVKKPTRRKRVKP